MCVCSSYLPIFEENDLESLTFGDFWEASSHDVFPNPGHKIGAAVKELSMELLQSTTTVKIRTKLLLPLGPVANSAQRRATELEMGPNLRRWRRIF